LVLTNLGLVALGQDECKRAANRFMEGLIQFRDLGNTVGSAFCLKGLACVLAQHPAGTQQSVQLFGAATALLAVSGAAVAYIDQPTDRYLADMRSRLAAVTFAAAWAAGQAMTLEQAIALALEATNVSLEERAI
jgi:hypothetical protein